MYSTEVKIRVRYCETDQMGYVYYGNYAQYFEVARVEALRELGVSYRDMEAGGIMLPVYSLNVKYVKPAVYDDLLTIKTRLPEIPKARITFQHEVYNERHELLNIGEVILVFINIKTKKPIPAPEDFLKKIRKYY